VTEQYGSGVATRLQHARSVLPEVTERRTPVDDRDAANICSATSRSDNR
jgi:hypothetical protein